MYTTAKHLEARPDLFKKEAKHSFICTLQQNRLPKNNTKRND